MVLEFNMDISDFNRKLSIFIADARALEKTDRRRANAMWLKICEFAIEYSKQKNVDRSLRIRIWKQVELILKKVKGEEIESSTTPSSPVTRTEEKSIPFEVDFGLDFPSVPKGDESEQEKDSSSVPFQSPPPPEDTSVHEDEDARLFQDAISDKSSGGSSVASTDDFVTRIRRMEEELRKMPDIFKEIKPSDYTPDKSIIPSSAPPPHISPETPTDAPQMLDKSNTINIEPVERPDIIDPYKGTKQNMEITDPFGPDSQIPQVKKEDSSDEEGKHCYACGAPVGEKDSSCSKCGAEL